MNFVWINIFGDIYDIYVEIGNYVICVNIYWDCIVNVIVFIYILLIYLVSKFFSVIDGVVYMMYSIYQKLMLLDIGVLLIIGGIVLGLLFVIGGLIGLLNGNVSIVMKLQMVRFIGGVGFDGFVNINFSGVNIMGNQNIIGNVVIVIKLQIVCIINGVKFDGFVDIMLIFVNFDVYSKSEIDNKKGMRKYIFLVFVNVVSGKWYFIVFC